MRGIPGIAELTRLPIECHGSQGGLVKRRSPPFQHAERQICLRSYHTAVQMDPTVTIRMMAKEATPTAMVTEIEKTMRTALSNALDINGLTTLQRTENKRHARKRLKQTKAGFGSQ